jgi:hypothetical protein
MEPELGERIDFVELYFGSWSSRIIATLCKNIKKNVNVYFYNYRKT